MQITYRRYGLVNLSYDAVRGLLLWLMLLNPGWVALGVAGGATVGFATKYVLMITDPAKTTKDAQQDMRMDAADERDKREEEERIERRAEVRARLDIHDVELKDLDEKVSQLWGWGMGAFGAITVLQVVGLLKKKKEDC